MEELDAFLGSSSTTSPTVNPTLDQIVKKEMALFEATQTRPSNLDRLFRSLLTIRPTSVEPERAFSAMGWFVTRLRTRLNDKTLDALIFMRHYYKQQPAKTDKSS